MNKIKTKQKNKLFSWKKFTNTSLVKAIMVLLICSAQGWSQDKNVDDKPKNDEKIYTQKEFDEKMLLKLKDEIVKFKQKGIVELTQEVVDKEIELQKRENELRKREEDLNVNLKNFNDKIKQFDERQNNFIACVKKQDEDKNARISKMVQVISSMKPDKAAALITAQDPEISVKILSQLESDKTSKIFNLMDKEKSAQLQKQYLDMKR